MNTGTQFKRVLIRKEKIKCPVKETKTMKWFLKVEGNELLPAFDEGKQGKITNLY